MARFAPASSNAKALKSPRAIAPKPKPILRVNDRAEGAFTLAPVTAAHAPPIQAKLEIGEPNDEFEKEADAVADHVMRMTDAAAAPPEQPDPTRSGSPTVLQRACAKCEQDDEKLQRDATSGAGPIVGPAPSRFAQDLAAARAAGGSALPGTVRAFMEPRFGQDFRGVRVHQDARADQLTRSVQARAFTVGRDLFFRQGQFQPSSNAGRHLIAHELTHIVQQQQGHAPTLRRQRVERDEECSVARPTRVVIATATPGRDRLVHLLPEDRVQLLGIADASWARIRVLTGLQAGTRGLVQVRSLSRCQESRSASEKVVEGLELEMVTPEESRALRGRGIDLPAVSAESADPKLLSDYVDQRLDAVGFGLTLGGVLLFLSGLSRPVFVPDSVIQWGNVKAESATSSIFPNRDAAVAAIPIGPTATYAFFRGSGGVIFPTVFSVTTTPRVLTSIVKAQREFAQQVQREFTVLALSLLGGKLISVGVARVLRIGTGTIKRPSLGETSGKGSSAKSAAPELEGLQVETQTVLEGSRAPTSTRVTGKGNVATAPQPEPVLQAERPPAASGPLKNRSGNLEAAARARRTQPHGPPSKATAEAAEKGEAPGTRTQSGQAEGPELKKSGLSVVERPNMASRVVVDANGNVVELYGQSGSSSTTPGHDATIEREALRLAQSGEYEYVVMQRSWRTATGRVGTSGKVPDVIGVRRNGKVDAIEVQSRTDDPKLLLERLRSGRSSLPAENRGEILVVEPKL